MKKLLTFLDLRVIELVNAKTKMISDLPIRLLPSAAHQRQALVHTSHELWRLDMDGVVLSVSQVIFGSTVEVLLSTLGAWHAASR